MRYLGIAFALLLSSFIIFLGFISGADVVDLIIVGAVGIAFSGGLLLDSFHEKSVQKIAEYMKTTPFKQFLINNQVFCYFNTEDKTFYIKEKTDGKVPGRCFQCIEFGDRCATAWGLIQKKFNKMSTLDSLLNLKLGMGYPFSYMVTEALHTPFNICYNEYFVMEWNENKDEIKVSEYWPDSKKRSFIIKGFSSRLIELIGAYHNPILEDYDGLFLKLKHIDNNLEVEEIKKPVIKQVDINNATFDELKALPIVNIITAKKLIKKREEIGGFDSVLDVCIFLRLTPSQEERFSQLICVRPMKISPAKIKTDERNVDL